MADLYLSETELDDLVLNNKDWETWTPTTGNDGASGPPTMNLKWNRYTVIGNVCYVHFEHEVTNDNGALGAYTVTLPVAPACPDGQVILYGRETANVGRSMFGTWVSASSHVRILRDNSANPITTNHVWAMAGSYRV